MRTPGVEGLMRDPRNTLTLLPGYMSCYTSCNVCCRQVARRKQRVLRESKA